jgi:autotransporter adhesin
MLLVFTVSAPPFAFAQFLQSYSAGGGSTPGNSGNLATAVCGGSCTASGGIGSSAYGNASTASGVASSAYGLSSNATAGGSSAFGETTLASQSGSSAFGAFSRATGLRSVTLGSSANASALDSVALGSGSVADQANTVSVGAPGSERRITNIAPGVNPTDAVNVSQLSGLQDLSGLHNDISALHDDIGNVASSAYRGIAGVAALTAGISAVPGKTTINAGVGAYKGYAAGAITASHTTENGRFNFNGGIGITSGAPVYRAGVGFSF